VRLEWSINLYKSGDIITYSVITSALNDDNFHNHKYLIGKVLKKKNRTNVRRLKIYIYTGVPELSPQRNKG
jgi:hypothetical protein